MRFLQSFLDDLRSRFTLSDIVARKVTWDARKSNPGRGDYWAPCPFHQEKTASFHVDDRKGFYHCFGCQASGDLFKFVMETDNLSFTETVERLAEEAGMDLPARDESLRAAQAREQRDRLGDAMDEAVRFYRAMLNGAAGQGARAYIERRGLAPETVTRFELGYAPEGGALARHLEAKGLVAEGVEAGLLMIPDEDRGRGRAPFDRFRDRLMFPIRDQRGRAIAFGGRALSANAQAKYLNSPETPLFSKGRTLFNVREGRTAAGKTGAVIVAEGYMDVIALVAAGFEHAVAPLGTAVTEEQLALLWRMADEPVIALDGDTAGLRAANRLVDLALPHLAPGKSLRFCLMPQGRDPDDLIRAEGPAAMAAALENAVPLVEMLWRREVAAGPLDTPERRAGFDQRLRAALSRIADVSVRRHYAAALKDRRAAQFQPLQRGPGVGPGVGPGAGSKPGGFGWAARGRFFGRGQGRGGAGPGYAPGPSPEALARREAFGRDSTTRAAAREAAILCSVWECADLLGDAAAQIEDMAITSEALQDLHAAALNRVVGIDGPVDESRFAEVAQQAGARGLSFLGRLSGSMVRLRRPSEAECCQIVLDALAHHHAELAREAEHPRHASWQAEGMAEPAAEIDLDSGEMLDENRQADFAARYGRDTAQLRAVLEERDRRTERTGESDAGEQAAEEWRRLLEELDLPPEKE